MNRSIGTDQAYLLNEQYRDSTNFDARVQLHLRFSTNPRGWLPWAFDHLLKSPSNSKILEVGCGPCYIWTENLDRTPAGWEITLSDFSQGMLEQGQKNLGDRAKRFIFQQVDVQKLPFHDGRFDVVMANHMLYHVPDLPKAITEIRRVLKPGGRLLAGTNGRGHHRQMKELRLKFEQMADNEIGPDFADAAGELTFELETGEAFLSPHFSNILLHRYIDGLSVTEVEPLLAYMMSGLRYSVGDEHIKKFREFLAAEMAARSGVIHIDKAIGLFEAVV